jgi:hypothetical protein
VDHFSSAARLGDGHRSAASKEHADHGALHHAVANTLSQRRFDLGATAITRPRDTSRKRLKNAHQR